MTAQLDLLRSRDVSSARGLTWPSQGLGPQIALQVELNLGPWEHPYRSRLGDIR